MTGRGVYDADRLSVLRPYRRRDGTFAHGGSTHVGVRLAPHELAALDRVAVLRGLTRSDVIRAALTAFLASKTP